MFKGALDLCFKFLESTIKSCHTDIQGINSTDSDEEKIPFF